jgi:hypothetical protein
VALIIFGSEALNLKKVSPDTHTKEKDFLTTDVPERLGKL